MVGITRIYGQGAEGRTPIFHDGSVHGLTLVIPYTDGIIIAMFPGHFRGGGGSTYLKLMYSKWPQNVDNFGYIGKYFSKYMRMCIRKHEVTMHQCVSLIKKG